MRGEELKEIRRQNLLRLRQRHTLEQIAERTGTNSVYLSQIANRVIQKNGKSPRALSDAYAGKIERGLGLPEGWMDQDHDSATIEATAKVQMPADDLPLAASGHIEVTPEPSLSDLLDALSARLEQADPAVRDEVMRLVLRYMEHPQSGARIVRAIEELLGSEHDHSPA